MQILKRDSLQLEGVKELTDILKNLPTDVKEKILRSATRSGGQVFRKEVKARAPLGQPVDLFGRPRAAGRLKGAIKLKSKVTFDNVFATTFVHPGRGRDSDKGAFYAHMVEKGHRLVISVKGRGGNKILDTGRRVKAVPFMEPAFNAKRHQVVRTVESKLKSKVARLAKQRGKQ